MIVESARWDVVVPWYWMTSMTWHGFRNDYVAQWVLGSVHIAFSTPQTDVLPETRGLR